MSKTTENMKTAFAGESMARNKYTFFAKAARKEGYHYIAKLFEETATHEMRHANDHFKLLGGLGDTAANLKDAISGEEYETTTMYPEFAAIAKKEGNKEAAALFSQLGKIEQHHRERFKKLLARVENGTVFSREEPIQWKCSLCGHVHKGTEPPPRCPSCKHPKEYYEPASLENDM
ncbi:MAG: rubrerythrin [Proteobacteria bacterium]|nr:MAG: rubrerythrin [Pseudomonadota bacterium]PIE65446.1 MAG: rubrerythrin [Desulfobacterales bacterium]